MKTIAYLRVSTGKQALSLEAQRTRIEAFAAAMGIVLEGTFVDEAVSGGLPFASRPEGAKAMEALRGGGRILAVHLDRCFRSLADTDATLAEWRKLEVTLTVLDMGGSPLDFSSASGRLLVRLLASVAEFEKEIIGERTSEALQEKKEKGEVYCRIPYGFTREGDILIPHPAEQEILEQIRNLRSSGLGVHGIAAALNADHIPTKRAGAKWYPSTVIQSNLDEAARLSLALT